MNISRTTARMWHAATDLADAVRADWGTVTGRRWRRQVRECPPWCGQGHVCTALASYPSGQHRSTPATWQTSYGSLVATRVGGLDGRNRIEVRTIIALPADDDTAGQQAQGLLTAIHLTITSLTATPPAPITSRHVPALAGATRPAVTGGAQ